MVELCDDDFVYLKRHTLQLFWDQQTSGGGALSGILPSSNSFACHSCCRSSVTGAAPAALDWATAS